MLTSFGRQLVMIIALFGLVALLPWFFLSSQGRALALLGQDAACQQAGVCIAVYRR
jgi:hypothetical protein